MKKNLKDTILLSNTCYFGWYFYLPLSKPSIPSNLEQFHLYDYICLFLQGGMRKSVEKSGRGKKRNKTVPKKDQHKDSLEGGNRYYGVILLHARMASDYSITFLMGLLCLQRHKLLIMDLMRRNIQTCLKMIIPNLKMIIPNVSLIECFSILWVPKWPTDNSFQNYLQMSFPSFKKIIKILTL